MPLKNRIGYDAGETRLENALATAAVNAFPYLNFNADRGPNRLDNWDAARVAAVTAAAGRHGITLTLHTASAVNIAEFSPFVDDAVDRYLESNIDLARRLGCNGVVVHGGYHFSSAVAERMAASLARLQRAVAYAEQAGVTLLLENLNLSRPMRKSTTWPIRLRNVGTTLMPYRRSVSAGLSPSTMPTWYRRALTAFWTLSALRVSARYDWPTTLAIRKSI